MSFEASKHARFLLRYLDSLPAPYASLDTNRLSLAYFCVVGLDALGQLSSINAERVRRWVYSLQLVPPVDDHHLPPQRAGGFRGSAFLGAPHMPAGSPSTSEYDGAHLAMTYTALAVLLTLGDDLTGVDSERVLAFVASLQQDDGCFCAYLGGESDMRFLFCAAAVVTMLHGGSVPRDSAIDVEKATQYVLSSRCYDGGIGLGPGQESHGGSTYTGLAALALMGTLDRLPRPEATIGWCMGRQVGGFQGRPGKDEDTCYSFWIGASLALLGVPKMIHVNALCTFCNSCQFAVGGISKHAGAYPDVLHTHYAICGLALTGQPGLQPIDVRLGITARAAARHAPSCVECGDESAGTKCSLA